MAVSFMALVDSPDLEKALHEIFRVIRRNGDFFFSITHPCFVTKGYGWLKNRKGQSVKLTVANYFSDTPYIGKLDLPRSRQFIP